jgi:hypothetical protein
VCPGSVTGKLTFGRFACAIVMEALFEPVVPDRATNPGRV